MAQIASHLNGPMSALQPKASFTPQDLREGTLPFHLLQNVLTYYADLPCFLIAADRLKVWNLVVPLRQKKDTPIDYEDHRQWEARIRYNERTLRRVVKEQRALCLPHHGMHGLFVPVVKGGSCLGVLQSGPFLRAVPSEADVAALWQGLSGHAPRPQEAAFLEYVRSIADTPVLDDALVEGLRRLLEVFGAFLTRSMDGKEAARSMDAVQTEVFARRLWHRQWVEWQVIQPKFFRFNGDPKALMAWEKAELGLNRFPTTVLAAKREGTGREWTDWLAAMTFQREARKLGPELGEALVHPLSNYGVLLLTSAGEGMSAVRAEAEIRAKAGLFTRRMSQALGCKVWVGMGRGDKAGTRLQASYHEAVSALHLAVARNQEIVAYAEEDQAASGETALRHKVQALARAALPGAPAPAMDQRGVFVQEVLIGTRGRPEATRRVFMETLQRLLASLEGGKSLPPNELAALESRLTQQMETALNLNEMVGRFEAGLDLLLGVLEQPLRGEKRFRLERAMEAVAASLERPWTLPTAAREFGFSTTSFSREFSRQAGLPFSEFLLNQRLDKARRLLAEGGLPLGGVAEACGFRSANYFMQVFKRRCGVAAGKYRKQHLHKNE